MSDRPETDHSKRFIGAVSAQSGAGVILVAVKASVIIDSAIKTADRWLSSRSQITACSFAVRAGQLDIADQIRDRFHLDGEPGQVRVINVCGFELLSTETLNDMCSMLNRDRDILASLPAVLVFWLNDTVLGALARRAPFFVSGPFLTIDLTDGFDGDESVRIGREHLVKILSRFPFCLRRHSDDLANEADLQRILWTILRSHYEDVVDEEHLPKVGVKQYRFDFGIKHLRVLVEAKFVRPTKSLSELQDELFADVLGYFSVGAEFDRLLFFIYDASSRQHDWPPLISALVARPEVLDVLVIPYVRLQ